MNNKGFTLVELLAVIVILAIITSLANISVTKIMKDSKNDLTDVQIKLIEDAAHVFISSNLDKTPNSGDCVYITLGTLKETGILNDNIKNFKKNEDISDDLIIKISAETSEYGNLIFNYDIDVKNDKECVYVQPNKVYKTGEIVYFDVEEGSLCTETEYKESYNETVDDYLNSKTGYNGINKMENQNSCLKFYAFNDDLDNKTLDLILDHNTTAYVAWNSTSNIVGPNEVIVQLYNDTKKWKGTVIPKDYSIDQTGQISNAKYTINYSKRPSYALENDGAFKARLITLREIAEITKNINFDETTSFTYYYFNSLTNNAEIGRGDVCASTVCEYGWLYDRTKVDCETYGCKNNSYSEYDETGYWTSHSDTNYLERALYVNYEGMINGDSVNNSISIGVRPVITILKK